MSQKTESKTETVEILGNQCEHVTPESVWSSKAKWAKNIRAVLTEQQETVAKAALKQSSALMKVVKVMVENKRSFTQQEYADVLGISQAYVSMTFRWYRKATKPDAEVIQHNGTKYPVSDIQSFIRLLDSGVGKGEMDAAYPPDGRKRSSPGKKTAADKLTDSLINLSKNSEDMNPLDKESAKKLANQIVEGSTDLAAGIEAMQAQAAEDASIAGKADAFINLGDSIVRMLNDVDGALGALKKGQAEELVRVASEIINAIEGVPGEETDKNIAA